MAALTQRLGHLYSASNDSAACKAFSVKSLAALVQCRGRLCSASIASSARAVVEEFHLLAGGTYAVPGALMQCEPT